MGTLYVIATPVGNLEDITLRAIRILGGIDVLACEDTRRTRVLFERHHIRTPPMVISYREDNEKTAVAGVMKLLREEKSVGLVSDAGYPALSDPGYRLVAAAIKEGVKVEVVPGAGAFEPALILSGLPTSTFLFLGFPPRKTSQLSMLLEKHRELPHTLIFYESPLRTVKLLQTALEVLGDRKAAVCIEMTKMFEEIRRGFLRDLAAELESRKIKGEVTVVIAGNNRKFAR